MPRTKDLAARREVAAAIQRHSQAGLTRLDLCSVLDLGWGLGRVIKMTTRMEKEGYLLGVAGQYGGQQWATKRYHLTQSGRDLLETS
jgi:hypothetical protein